MNYRFAGVQTDRPELLVRPVVGWARGHQHARRADREHGRGTHAPPCAAVRSAGAAEAAVREPLDGALNRQRLAPGRVAPVSELQSDRRPAPCGGAGGRAGLPQRRSGSRVTARAAAPRTRRRTSAPGARPGRRRRSRRPARRSSCMGRRGTAGRAGPRPRARQATVRGRAARRNIRAIGPSSKVAQFSPVAIKRALASAMTGRTAPLTAPRRSSVPRSPVARASSCG